MLNAQSAVDIIEEEPKYGKNITTILECILIPRLVVEGERLLIGGLDNLAHYLMGGDKVFLTKTAKYFGIKNVRIAWSNSRKRHPDIWVDLSQEIPVITVTQEWLKQSADERRKRLVHEMAHIIGLEHGRMKGLTYSTWPGKDTWSWEVYKDIVKGNIHKKFDPWRWL